MVRGCLSFASLSERRIKLAAILPRRATKTTQIRRVSASLVTQAAPRADLYRSYMFTGKKTPGGAGTLTRHTEHADAQRHTDESHNQPNPPTTHTPHVTRQVYRYRSKTGEPVKRRRGETGQPRDTRADEPHNHPNPPTHPRDRETTALAADSTAAAPEPTAPRGRLGRGRYMFIVDIRGTAIPRRTCEEPKGLKAMVGYPS